MPTVDKQSELRGWVIQRRLNVLAPATFNESAVGGGVFAGDAEIIVVVDDLQVLEADVAFNTNGAAVKAVAVAARPSRRSEEGYPCRKGCGRVFTKRSGGSARHEAKCRGKR